MKRLLVITAAAALLTGCNMEDGLNGPTPEDVTAVDVCRHHGGVAEVASGYWNGNGERALPTVCKDGFAGIAREY